jgi:hypothetical protein
MAGLGSAHARREVRRAPDLGRLLSNKRRAGCAGNRRRGGRLAGTGVCPFAAGPVHNQRAVFSSAAFVGRAAARIPASSPPSASISRSARGPTSPPKPTACSGSKPRWAASPLERLRWRAPSVFWFFTTASAIQTSMWRGQSSAADSQPTDGSRTLQPFWPHRSACAARHSGLRHPRRGRGRGTCSLTKSGQIVG